MILSAVAVLSACEESGAKPTTTVQAPDSADQVLEGFSHYVTREGIRRSRVEADTAYFYEASQITELRNIRVVFFDARGAEGLHAHRQAGHIPLAGRVDGRREHGGRGLARRADAAHAKSPVRQREQHHLDQHHFTFDRGTEHLEGNSFRSDPDFKNVVTDRPRGVAGDGHAAARPGTVTERRAGLGARALGMASSRGWRWSPGPRPAPGGRKPPAPTPPAPKPAPPRAAPAPSAAVRVPDRQRRPAGAVNETPSGTNYFAGGNVRLSCRGTQIAMPSDSVAAYGGNVVQFIGQREVPDSTLTMDADFGTYYKNGERWAARGNVSTKNLETGSTLTGPSLDYFRAVPGVRDTLEMYAVGRPKIKYVEADSAAVRHPDPYLIVADRVRFKGNNRIWAGEKVTIDRCDFAARSDRCGSTPARGATARSSAASRSSTGSAPTASGSPARRIDLKLQQRAPQLGLGGQGRGPRRQRRLGPRGRHHRARPSWHRKLERHAGLGQRRRGPTRSRRAVPLTVPIRRRRGRRAQLLKEVRGFGKEQLN